MFHFFRRILQVFYLDVVYVYIGFLMCLQVFQTHVSSVPSIFFYMLQVLHLDVSKVNGVLHMGCAWEAAGSAGVVRGGMGPLLGRSVASPMLLGRLLARCVGSFSCMPSDASAPDQTSGR
jgi:uncharacterized protein YqgC (DUF456 family)